MFEIPRESLREVPASVGASRSIGEVAEATGISADTLRVWERRYGRPRAIRLPSGHRRYTTDQVTWLRRVAEGIARGHRPSELLRLDEDALTSLLLAPSPGIDDTTRMLIDHIRHYRRATVVDILQRDWRRLHPREFLEDRVVPLLEAVGRLWADGGLEIRHEHFLTEVLQDTLRGLRLDLPEQDRAHLVIVAALSGETHGLALQMLALLAALHGVRAHLLGGDMPPAEIADAAKESGADAVVISVSLATGGVATDRLLGSLRVTLDEGIELVVGGAGARGPRRGSRGITYLEDLLAFETWLDRLTADDEVRA